MPTLEEFEFTGNQLYSVDILSTSPWTATCTIDPFECTVNVKDIWNMNVQ